MHPYHKQKKKSSYWKSSSILVVTVLLMIILLVPTLIVAPHTTKLTKEQSVEQVNEEVTEPVMLTSKDSAFSVQVVRTATDKKEKVLLEDYVTRVVASEMPAEFEIEALKAQALAARTYIVNYLSHVQNKQDVTADVTDTIQHQVYKNDQELRTIWGKDYNWKIKKIKQAVAATVGEIVTYENQPITPAFFSTSNGYTENSEDYWENALPYLSSVVSPWDQDSPKFLDQKIIPIDQVEQALDITLTLNSKAFPITRTESNRVKTIEIAGKTFTGRDIREALGLRSSDFSIEQKNEHFIFTTKGYGHGIGMSQYGANGMAKDGKKYQDILTYYYKGVEIETIEHATPTLVVQK